MCDTGINGIAWSNTKRAVLCWIIACQQICARLPTKLYICSVDWRGLSQYLLNISKSVNLPIPGSLGRVEVLDLCARYSLALLMTFPFFADR